MSAETRLQALRAWVRQATGLPEARVVVAPFDGPRPALPYVTVQALLPTTAPQHDAAGVVQVGEGESATWVEVVRGDRRTTFDVNLYSTTLDIDDMVESLRHAMQSPMRRKATLLGGLVVVGVGSPRDLSELVDTRHERRLQVEVTIAYAVRHTTAVETIEAVEAQGQALSSPGGASNSLVFTVAAGEPVPVPPEEP